MMLFQGNKKGRVLMNPKCTDCDIYRDVERLKLVDRKLSATSFVLEVTKRLYVLQDREKLLKEVGDMLIGLVGATKCNIYNKDLILMYSTLRGTNLGDRYFDLIHGTVKVFIINTDDLSLLIVPLYDSSYSVDYYIVLEHNLKGYFKDEHLELLSLIQPILYIILNNSLEYTNLKNAVLKDELTEAYNLRYFRGIYKDVFDDFNYVLCSFDIDFFKRVNDTYGHSAGDIVLKELVLLVKNSIRSDDILCRVGGEEFIIVFKNVSKAEDIYNRIESIRKKVESSQIYIDDTDFVNITISIGLIDGVTVRDIVGVTGDKSRKKILSYLDEALYKSKVSGRNQITLYKLEDLKKSM